MILLVKSGGETAVPAWQAAFRDAAPHLSVHWWADPAIAREDVSYVLVWQPEPGWLASLKNLRLICSSAAGVDHITRDPAWPSHLSIVRMGGHETSQRMGEYVALGALSLLRDMKRVVTAQAARKWDYFETPRNATLLRAGVMGMGNLGAHAAQVLRGLGFVTAGWSQTRKSIDGIESFAGAAEFDAFLARTDILVCLLPDTAATRGIIDARAMAKLPRGAGIVNAGRGSHIVTADLIAALDSGHLCGAFLDVFDTEPLPPDDALWTHPKVIVTPHLASLASIPERARYVAGVIAAFEAGEALPNLYVPERGY